MQETKRFKGLRTWVIVMLAFLVLQYEFGIAFNLTNLPSLSPFGFSLVQFNNALNRVGPVAQTHAGWGVIVGVLAIVLMILSLRSGIRSVQVFGSLGFVGVLVAGIMGQFFVMSGYQNDNYSHGMATFFILTFIFYFLELYFLKPARRDPAR